ncbi:hypothetical protein [Pseudoneobacillus sp. C159]
MKKNFKGFGDGKEYLLTIVKTRWFSPLTLYQLAQMKRRLVRNYSESELRTLRVSLNASHAKYSNFTPLGIFLTIMFSGCFSILSSFSMVAIQYGTNIYMEFLKGNFESNSENPLSYQLYQILQKDFNDKNVFQVIQDVFISNISSYFQLFGVFLLAILGALIFYYVRFNKVSKLKFLIDEAIEEKKCQNDQSISMIKGDKANLL